MDAGNMLKPMLARGELHCIGATTLDEYRKYIEKDKALERRFQPVLVDEPSLEETISILRGLKERYEVYHGVKITDSALVSAATLSQRYITDRFLPDKAIDLVDEACALIKTELNSLPTELDELQRKIMQMEIEEAALKKETDALSRERLADLQKDLAELRDTFNGMKVQWENEKKDVESLKVYRERIDELNSQIEIAKREYNLNRAAELQYGELPKVIKELEQAEARVKGKDMSMVHEEVTDDEIGRIVSKWTGIPVAKLTEGEREKVLHLEDELHKRVVGQDEAVSRVADAILRSKAGIKDPKRPIGSFLFLGPTGVGKTELARTLAANLFDDENNMVRIDMSEYMEKFSVSRLIGAPPGYVGYDEGGQLTEAVRRKPFSVVLFDEVEKAHPDVFNVLLQVLDDGHITDSQGRTVDFKNTIIIMTSNVGAREVKHSTGMGFTKLSESDDYERMEATIHEEAKNVFSPEFLNRIDDQIVFRSLNKKDLIQIVDILLANVQKNLSERGVLLEFSEKAKEVIVDHGYDPALGARPLRRSIQQLVEDELSEGLLMGTFTDFSTIKIDVDENGKKLTFTKEDLPGKNP